MLTTAALLPGLLSGLVSTVALTCAPAPPPNHHVDIAAEQAVIVWDPATRTEHFIRRADFGTDAPAFGFLVPTPSVPTLAEAPDSVFEALAKATEPETVHETEWDISWTTLSMFTLGAAGDKAALMGAVQVLHEQRVAGFDAVVLAADDPKALASWLTEHGFASRPELEEWLTPYVADGWKLTAFKVARESEPSAFGTAAVRMTFETDRPFYPYREPADQRDERAGGGRTLAVWLVAPGGHAGTIGADTRWSADLLYRATLPELPALLDGVVPEGAIPDGAWLHGWLDWSSPRPGTDDLWFAPSAEVTEYRPPPYRDVDTRHAWIPLDLIAVALFIGWLWRRARRRRQAT